MNNIIVKIILVIIVAISCILITLGALFKIMHWNGADEMLIVGMCAQCLIIIVFFIDVILASIDNKWSWIIGGVLNPIGGSIIYFSNKNDLIKIKELKDKCEIE
jgi:hypothetical protein